MVVVMKTTRQVCKECDAYRPFDKHGPNHILHLLLTLLTFGLWSVIWLLITIGKEFEPYHCRVCGEKWYRQI